ncbi:hypothetical protein NQZ68_022793 [Dissostichus eleginoides]|nr:hypothetical protein NQZ68_022793 [Dissostichus eleginoides]
MPVSLWIRGELEEEAMPWQKLRGQAAAAVVGVVVAHRSPLIQWHEVPLPPVRVNTPPLFSSTRSPFLFPGTLSTGAHTHSHMHSHTHTGTHTEAELWTPQRQSPRRRNIPIVPPQFSSLAFSSFLRVCI